MTLKKQCRTLYREAFGESPEFDNQLFDSFFENAEMLKIDSAVAAMFFKIPCILKTNDKEIKAYYLYAVTTGKDYRHQGLMSKLFREKLCDGAFYFLKPSSEGVQKFYELQGFKKIIGTIEDVYPKIEVSDSFKNLSALCDKPRGEYTLMIKSNLAEDIEKLSFKYTLE